jgi:mono/diheme cytochrome c family protein/rhodanese-related sulfurtransferase/catechol 2,3-dioxygenase-like lactoylglutathione lyase family enzyme
MLSLLKRFNATAEKRYTSALLKTIAILAILVSASCANNETEAIKKNYSLVGIGHGLHAATLMVNDLNRTRDFYTDTLGFKMAETAKFEKGFFDGTLVTSINFPDASKLDFLSVEDSLITDSPPTFITSFLANHEGIPRYYLSSSSVDTTALWLNEKGFKMDSIQAYRTSTEPVKGWSRDDGGLQERSLDFQNANATYLPQFIEDATIDYERMYKDWKTYYAYFRSYTNHPNGVVGINAIQVAVKDLDAARKDIENMGLMPSNPNASEKTARFKIKGHQELVLSTPQASNDDMSKFIVERESGVYAIRFDVKNIDSTYHYLNQRLPAEALLRDTIVHTITVPRQFAYGVQIEFVNEPKEQALLAEQYKIGAKLDSTASSNAAGMYQKYCALCHGKNREGYAADNAPSLRSHSLMATSTTTNFQRYTVQYGREGTAMGGYLNTQGGPLEYIEIELLLQWLYDQSGVEKPIELSREPVTGDVAVGAEIYANTCSVCHGADGEGISAPALGNSMFLATATDEFLKYAIKEGRDGTPMIAFKDSLIDNEINGLTAFLRTRASGWNIPSTDTISVPTPDKYILNPTHKAPKFNLRKGLYVPAKEVYQALQDSARMIILDARSEVAWRQTHIPGSVPVPYYEEPEAFVDDLPNDGTWIVAYCACPHAASGRVVSTLRRLGYKNTAIIDEGILVWGQLGYPVNYGQ